MASRVDLRSGDRRAPIAGIVLVARGDESDPAHDGESPQSERLRILLDGLAGGGCDELYVALGSRMVRPPEDSSTTLFLPDWFDALDHSLTAAIEFAREREDLAGVVLQTVDGPLVGAEGVRRVITAGGRRRDGIARVTWQGQWSQPVYVGAELLADAANLLRESGGAIAYLESHAGEVVRVDCSDLTSTP